jgi:hypothetical protein
MPERGGVSEKGGTMGGSDDAADLRLRDDVDGDLWDITAKGWFPAELSYRGRTYAVTFYDPVRLAQTIEDDLEQDGFFFAENLIVVKTVELRSLDDAVRKLVETGQINRLIPSGE